MKIEKMLIYVLLITVFMAIFVDQNDSIILVIVAYIVMGIVNFYFLWKILRLILSALTSEVRDKIAKWAENYTKNNFIILKVLNLFKKTKCQQRKGV